MNDSQRVVDKAHIVGGWIPVPQEMFAATGIDEATVLGTKQWGKVVPMMRKIGDYVLEHYLANDPRKAMVLKWMSRYCVAPNQKKKENMISPIVGFIYMLDSFKNHRGPSELGRARNTWRKRLIAQINCKAVWKRTHTALAKILHNRMNMADANPGKQFTKVMRQVYRDPNVPWSVADYGNLGYPGDDDEDAPLSVENALAVPAVAPTAPMEAPKPAGDVQGEANLDLIEASNKPAANHEEMSDGEDDDNSAPPPQSGKVPIPQAATAQNAEANFNNPGTSGDQSDDDDEAAISGDKSDGDDDTPGQKITQEGFPAVDAVPKKVEPQPAEVTAPPAQPPPDAPGEGVATTVPEATETPATETPAQAQEDQLPVQTSSPQDPVAQAVLEQNGQQPPPKPPDGNKVSIAEARAQEKIKELQTTIQELQASNDLLTQEKATLLEEKTKELQQAQKEATDINAKYKAAIQTYEQNRHAWETQKDALEKTRLALENKLTELSDQNAERIQGYETKLKDMEKQLEQLEEAREQVNVRLSEAGKVNTRLQYELDQLQAVNTRIAQEAQNLQQNDEDYESKLHDLQERADEQDKRAAEQQQKIEAAAADFKALQNERNGISKQLEAAQAELQKIKEERKSEESKYQKELEQLRSSLKSASSEVQQLANTRIALEEAQAANQDLERRIAEMEETTQKQQREIDALQKDIESLNAKIAKLEDENNALRSKLDQLEIRITDLEQELKNEQATSAENQNTIISLRQDLLAANTLIGQLKTQNVGNIEQAQAAMNNLVQEANQRHDAAVTQLKNEWAATEQQYTTTIASLNETITSSNEEQKNLRKKLEDAQSTKQAMENQMAENKQLIQALKDQLTTSTDENKKLAAILDTIKNTARVQTSEEVIPFLQNLQTQIQHFRTLETSLNEKETLVATLQEQVNQIAANAQATNNTNTQLQANIADLNRQIEELRAEIAQQQADMTAEKEKYNKTADDLTTEQNKNSILQAKNKELTDKIAELEKTNNEHAGNLSSLSATIRDLQNKIAKAEQAVLNASNAKVEAQQHQQNIEKEYAEKLEQIKAQNRKEIEALQNRIKELESNYEVLKNKNTELQTQLWATMEKIKTQALQLKGIPLLQQKIQDLNVELEEMEQAYERTNTERYVHPENGKKEPTTIAQEVSAAPPAVEYLENVQNIIIGNRSVTLCPILITMSNGKRRKVWLVIEWKEDSNPPLPHAIYYVNKRFEPIPDTSYQQLGLTPPAILQQRYWDTITKMRNKSGKADLDKYATGLQDIAFKNLNDIVPDAPEDLPQHVSSIINKNTASPEEEPTVAYDPAHLLPILDNLANANTNFRYGSAIIKILGKIRNWLEQTYEKVPDRLAFMKDEKWVSPERIEKMKNQIMQFGPAATPQTEYELIWSNLIRDANSLMSTDIAPRIKQWLHNWKFAPLLTERQRQPNDRMNEVLLLEPKVIYHVLTKLAYDKKGSTYGPRSSVFSGYGYDRPQSLIGKVPIPVGTNNAQNLYDYYGYGFNPFSKNLNNPPSYYTDDYFGYRPF